jgi:hypothetical protein
MERRFYSEIIATNNEELGRKTPQSFDTFISEPATAPVAVIYFLLIYNGLSPAHALSIIKVSEFNNESVASGARNPSCQTVSFFGIYLFASARFKAVVHILF